MRKVFTLIELLVVSAIIGILVTIVIIAINPVGVLHRSQDTRRRVEMNQIKTALQMYFNDNHDYPVTGSLGNLVTGGYITNQLPGVTTVTGFSYTHTVLTTTYTARVPVNISTQADTDSQTKCTGVAGSYYICPD